MANSAGARETDARRIDIRVEGAQQRLHELATRLDALFRSLDAPPPTPPWRLVDSESNADAEPQRAAPPSTSSVRIRAEHEARGDQLDKLRPQVEQLREAVSELERQLESSERRRAESLADLSESQDANSRAHAELGSLRGSVERLKARQLGADEDLQVARAELARARMESGPIDVGLAAGVDPEVFQQLEDELDLVKRELQETRRAHAQALDQMAAGLPEVSVNEDSVVRALRAEDAMKQMQEHLQRQLLEHEETRRQRDALRRTQEQQRGELRLAQQQRDKYKARVEAGGDHKDALAQLQRSLAARDKLIQELQSDVRNKTRELETQAKRELHLRQALNRAKSR